MNGEAMRRVVTDHAGARPRAAGSLRRRLGIGALLAVTIAAGIAAAQWGHHRLTHVDENDARVMGEVTSIASRLDGWVLARPVMEGDRVTKGQVLVELDSRDAKLRLAALVASVAAHEAQIRQTSIQRDTTEQTAGAQVADTRAQLAAAEAALDVATHQATKARADFARIDPLVPRGVASRQDWDHAQSTLLQAEATQRQSQALVTSRRAALTLAIAQLNQVPMLEQQVEVLRAQRDALAAQANQVRQEIADRTLRAPIDGIVDRTFTHPGDYAQAAQWLLMMHDPDAVWVEANIKETDIARVRTGAAVAVTVDAWSGERLRGRVERVGNAATNQFALLPSPNPSGNFTKITQRVPVRIAIDRPTRPLQPGLMVEVSIDVAD
jgi:membrane fusion protein, multidrug efflux system